MFLVNAAKEAAEKAANAAEEAAERAAKAASAAGSLGDFQMGGNSEREIQHKIKILSSISRRWDSSVLQSCLGRWRSKFAVLRGKMLVVNRILRILQNEVQLDQWFFLCTHIACWREACKQKKKAIWSLDSIYRVSVQHRILIAKKAAISVWLRISSHPRQDVAGLFLLSMQLIIKSRTDHIVQRLMRGWKRHLYIIREILKMLGRYRRGFIKTMAMKKCTTVWAKNRLLAYYGETYSLRKARHVKAAKLFVHSQRTLLLFWSRLSLIRCVRMWHQQSKFECYEKTFTRQKSTVAKMFWRSQKTVVAHWWSVQFQRCVHRWYVRVHHDAYELKMRKKNGFRVLNDLIYNVKQVGEMATSKRGIHNWLGSWRRVNNGLRVFYTFRVQMRSTLHLKISRILSAWFRKTRKDPVQELLDLKEAYANIMNKLRIQKDEWDHMRRLAKSMHSTVHLTNMPTAVATSNPKPVTEKSYRDMRRRGFGDPEQQTGPRATV